MLKVAIIIVHYNGDEETRECLKSLRKIDCTDLDVSTIVIDNGSKEIFTAAPSILPEKTTLLRSDTNLGFTSGNNLGIRHAFENFDPDYVLLLNNDTTVDKDFLVKLIECAKRSENVGAITPAIYFSPGREYHKGSYQENEVGKVFWYAGGSIDWKNLDAFHRGVDEVDRGHFSVQRESDFATGCCMLIPRKVLDQVGLFDSRYFLYLEDVDLSLRIAKAGYRLLFCSDSYIWHKNAGSSGGAGSALQQYYQNRNRLFFFTKYANWRIKLTVMRFAVKLLFTGTSMEQRATFDWLLGRMGKQSIL